jgi:hypothetical protein
MKRLVEESKGAGGPGSEVVDITVGERITLRHVSRE